MYIDDFSLPARPLQIMEGYKKMENLGWKTTWKLKSDQGHSQLSEFYFGFQTQFEILIFDLF